MEDIAALEILIMIILMPSAVYGIACALFPFPGSSCYTLSTLKVLSMIMWLGLAMNVGAWILSGRFCMGSASNMGYIVACVNIPMFALLGIGYEICKRKVPVAPNDETPLQQPSQPITANDFN